MRGLGFDLVVRIEALMSDAVVRFRSPRQPAHYVRAGRGYKFVGGRLAVSLTMPRRSAPMRWPTRRSGSSRSGPGRRGSPRLGGRGVSGLEITRVEWDPERALSTAEQLGRDALERGGERLLESAGRRVPYRTGALAASAQLAADDDGVAIGYTAPARPRTSTPTPSGSSPAGARAAGSRRRSTPRPTRRGS